MIDQPRSIGPVVMLVASGYRGQAGQAAERSGPGWPAWRHDGFRCRPAVPCMPGNRLQPALVVLEVDLPPHALLLPRIDPLDIVQRGISPPDAPQMIVHPVEGQLDTVRDAPTQPRGLAAWVMPRSRTTSSMRLTSSAFAKWTSASGRSRSAKTLPLPRSTVVSVVSMASVSTMPEGNCEMSWR